MNYLELQEVLDIHDLILTRTGGLKGVRNKNAIEYSISDLRVFNEEVYPYLHDKASNLMFNLCRYHLFNDGNKRTAHACTEIYLMKNGYELIEKDSIQEDILNKVAEGSIKKDQLSMWVKSIMTPCSRVSSVDEVITKNLNLYRLLF